MRLEGEPPGEPKIIALSGKRLAGRLALQETQDRLASGSDYFRMPA